MKNSKKKWTSNKNFLKILSLAVAIVCWIAVAMTSTATITKSVYNVPLNLEIPEYALSQLGLNIIDIDTTTVTAEVKGDRVAVGLLAPEQLAATLQLSSNFTEQGVYELQVVPAPTTTANVVGVHNQSYEISSYFPAKVQVRLDRIESKTFPIEAEMQGEVEIPEGYIRGKDEIVTPEEVVISGPQAELDKIDRCVVEFSVGQKLDKTYAADFPVKVLNADGAEINLEEHHLKIDNELAQVVVNVLKEKEIPLNIEFLNVPRSFPLQELSYEQSNYELAIAGPVPLVPKQKELLLGFVDLEQLSLQNNSFNFEVKLPTGFLNLDNIRTVNINFDMSNFTEEIFNLNKIQVLNAPNYYDVQLVTDEINNVVMVGTKEAISTLKAEDIVVELDLADKQELSLGQYQYPVRISAPTKGLVWATGEYNVIIQVNEKK